MNKSAIKTFAVNARRKLIADMTYTAGLLGVSEKGILSPLPESRADYQIFDIGTKTPSIVEGKAISQRNALVTEINKRAANSDYKTAFRSVVDEVAYTWFNRLIAIRFMEVNDYLPSHVRVLSSELAGKDEPDLVTNPFDADLELSAAYEEKIMQLKDENKLDELFQMLFIKQCNALHEILPRLFESTADYTEILLNISFSDKNGVVYALTHNIPEDDFNIEKGGQVEIIGWMYQYYNTEPKDEAFALLDKKIKITKERLPAATQLFTPDWIVRYMIQNSLGRLWVEGHPDEELKADWKYYLEEAEQEAEVQAQLEEIRKEYAQLTPEDIKIIDPCMGSGHILVYAFDVLMQIYESQGYSTRDIPSLILENNLYGLDIDERAAQLAYFALMMKAREYDRRFFNRGVDPQVYSAKGYAEGEEYGSLITVDRLEAEPDMDTWDMFSGDFAQAHKTWNFRRLMAQKYHVVCTNPPYLGGKKLGAEILVHLEQNYSFAKYDLYAAFMQKSMEIINNNGFVSMITQQGWMFLPTFERLRRSILKYNLRSLVQLGTRAFEDIGGEVVQTTAFVFRKATIPCYESEFIRLIDFEGEEKKTTIMTIVCDISFHRMCLKR